MPAAMTRTTLRLASLLVVLAGCGDGGGGDPVDAGRDGDGGLCAGRPCLLAIEDEGDWLAVSAAHAPDARCDFVEESKFLMPATPAASLQEIVFQDVRAHRLHLGFMTQVLPEYFGGLSPQEYQRIVQRRDTRQYWAGVLYRLVDDRGATIGWGWDVVVDPAWDEQLTEAEATAIQAQLATRFHLPLAYAPVSADAVYHARQFETLVAHFPRACWYTTCETPGVDCVEVPADLSLCAHFHEGRTLDVELATKARLTVPRRTVELPRALGTHTVPALFGAGERGPGRTAITPAGPARYEVSQPHPSFRLRRYVQPFTIGGRPFELAWELALPEGGGGYRLVEPHVNHTFHAMLGPPAATTQDDLSFLSSCENAPLEHWRITGATADGGRFTVDLRYGPPAAGSGPLFPFRGEVTLGDQTAVVDDYYALVYAGEHHNWNNQYWILFAAPITYRGHPIHGLWLDEEGFTFELEAAHTLDAARRPLDRLDVTSYDVARVP